MFPAQDSAKTAAARWLGIGLALALGATQSGCAFWQVAHKDGPPYLRVRPRPKAKEGKEPSPTAPAPLARGEQEPASPGPGALTRAGSSAPKADRPLTVALQPPRAIPDSAATRTSAPSHQTWARSGTTAAPKPAAPAESPARKAEAVVAEARARLDAIGSYQVRLDRQEKVGGSLQPREDVLLSIRRSPKAVRIEWTDGPHKGREVIYNDGPDGGLMQINMADSIVPVPRMTLPPDSPLALRNSRHPINEAGLDTVVAQVEAALKGQTAGDPAAGKVTYDGLEAAEGLDRPSHKIVRVLPDGETWAVYIDPQTKLPALVQAKAADGSLLERYVFRDLQPDPAALADASAFDADRRWGPKGGLFGRLANAAGAPDKPAESAPRRLPE